MSLAPLAWGSSRHRNPGSCSSRSSIPCQGTANTAICHLSEGAELGGNSFPGAISAACWSKSRGWGDGSHGNRIQAFPPCLLCTARAQKENQSWRILGCCGVKGTLFHLKHIQPGLDPSQERGSCSSSGKPHGQGFLPFIYPILPSNFAFFGS